MLISRGQTIACIDIYVCVDKHNPPPPKKKSITKALPWFTKADWPIADHPAAGVRATQVAAAPVPVRYAPVERVAGLAARARADRVAVVHLAEGVDAAGARHTGVGGGWSGNGTANVRVTRKAL